MIQQLKKWIQSKLFIYDEVVPVIKAKTEQENPRDAATRKRVRKAFEQQQQQMQARAMKAHSVDCPDPLTCNKIICYTFVADKIVSIQEVSINPGSEFKKSKLPDKIVEKHED